MAGVDEHQRLAGERAHRVEDVVVRDRAAAQPLRVGVDGQEIEALLVVGDAVAGHEHHAHVAAGDLAFEPIQGGHLVLFRFCASSVAESASLQSLDDSL